MARHGAPHAAGEAHDGAAPVAHGRDAVQRAGHARAVVGAKVAHGGHSGLQVGGGHLGGSVEGRGEGDWGMCIQGVPVDVCAVTSAGPAAFASRTLPLGRGGQSKCNSMSGCNGGGWGGVLGLYRRFRMPQVAVGWNRPVC